VDVKWLQLIRPLFFYSSPIISKILVVARNLKILYKKSWFQCTCRSKLQINESLIIKLIVQMNVVFMFYESSICRVSPNDNILYSALFIMRFKDPFIVLIDMTILRFVIILCWLLQLLLLNCNMYISLSSRYGHVTEITEW
jgi:hypothetical protein